MKKRKNKLFLLVEKLTAIFVLLSFISCSENKRVGVFEASGLKRDAAEVENNTKEITEIRKKCEENTEEAAQSLK